MEVTPPKGLGTNELPIPGGKPLTTTPVAPTKSYFMFTDKGVFSQTVWLSDPTGEIKVRVALLTTVI